MVTDVMGTSWLESLTEYLTDEGSPQSWRILQLVPKDGGPSKWGIALEDDADPIIICGDFEGVMAVWGSLLLAEERLVAKPMPREGKALLAEDLAKENEVLN